LRRQNIHTISNFWFEISLKPRRNPIEERRKEERLDVKPVMREMRISRIRHCAGRKTHLVPNIWSMGPESLSIKMAVVCDEDGHLTAIDQQPFT